MHAVIIATKNQLYCFGLGWQCFSVCSFGGGVLARLLHLITEVRHVRKGAWDVNCDQRSKLVPPQHKFSVKSKAPVCLKFSGSDKGKHLAPCDIKPKVRSIE
eukprot:4611638-Amphidinium_carterae.1